MLRVVNFGGEMRRARALIDIKLVWILRVRVGVGNTLASIDGYTRKTHIVESSTIQPTNGWLVQFRS